LEINGLWAIWSTGRQWNFGGSAAEWQWNLAASAGVAVPTLFILHYN
jgi:hypothetical protein